MPPLADVQARLRDAIVAGEVAAVLPYLVGGVDPAARLAIHRRHYEASLASALVTKFPACVWLLGSGVVARAAREFVRSHPPSAPCIAEYGAGFPGFLAARPGGAAYVRAFGELEWLLGKAAVAISRPPIEIGMLAGLDPEVLASASFVLQPGTAYLRAEWPVDDLARFFLSEAAPDSYRLAQQTVHLEIGGARGAFRFRRLEPAGYAFRSRIAEGATLKTAAEAALGIDPRFDAGAALVALSADALPISLNLPD